MVELVYNFDEKSIASVCKGELIAKMPFKLVFGSHTYIYTHINGHQPRSHNPRSCCMCRLIIIIIILIILLIIILRVGRKINKYLLIKVALG